MIDGYGLAFANKIRKGPIGIVAAAGTGLQQVAHPYSSIKQRHHLWHWHGWA
jgi:succinyl-CoA synthetase alpha subunit